MKAHCLDHWFYREGCQECRRLQRRRDGVEVIRGVIDDEDGPSIIGNPFGDPFGGPGPTESVPTPPVFEGFGGGHSGGGGATGGWSPDPSPSYDGGGSYDSGGDSGGGDSGGGDGGGGGGE